MGEQKNGTVATGRREAKEGSWFLRIGDMKTCVRSHCPVDRQKKIADLGKNKFRSKDFEKVRGGGIQSIGGAVGLLLGEGTA